MATHYATRSYKMFFTDTMIDSEVPSVMNFSCLAIPECEHWHVDTN